MANELLLPQISGNGYYPYSPMEQQYGTTETINTIVRISQDFFRNQRFQIGVGDISYKDGRNFPPHHSHKNGRCVDIRPLRTDRHNAPVTIQMAMYDRAATRLLAASLLAHRNVERVLFNDRHIPGVTPYAGHDNHLHVIMKA